MEGTTSFVEVALSSMLQFTPKRMLQMRTVIQIRDRKHLHKEKHDLNVSQIGDIGDGSRKEQNRLKEMSGYHNGLGKLFQCCLLQKLLAHLLQ